MVNVEIFHPETQATVGVPEESVGHYRQSGWVLRSDWVEQQAAEQRRAEQAAKDPKADQPRPAAAKASGTEKEK
jgi:hypothetical protein